MRLDCTAVLDGMAVLDSVLPAVDVCKPIHAVAFVAIM
jgi:hypothetical protein